MELSGGTIGAGAYAALRQGNKIYPIDDNTPLLHVLSGKTHGSNSGFIQWYNDKIMCPLDAADEEEGNDWLYAMAADIITAHNAFIEGVYSAVQAQRQSPLARFLPDEPSKVYPSEVSTSNCIVGKFRT